MTELDWLTGSDSRAMLDFVRETASRRKLRLFAVACCRRHRHMLVPETLAALDVAGRFADGHVGQDERRAARERAFHAPWHADNEFAHRRGPAKWCVTRALARQAFRAAVGTDQVAHHLGRMSEREWPSEACQSTDRGRVLTDPSSGEREQNAIQAALVRDVFGNPFRPVTMADDTVSASTASTAAAIYAGGSFDRLPELANALEGEGSVPPDVIEHCHLAGPHVRGCWAVDLLLGRT